MIKESLKIEKFAMGEQRPFITIRESKDDEIQAISTLLFFN